MLRGIDNEYQVRLENEAQSKLLTPFDYSSCEQIGESHSILKALYSDCFLGLEIIRSRNNLVLTGPRGCGKTWNYGRTDNDNILKGRTGGQAHRIGADRQDQGMDRGKPVTLPRGGRPRGCYRQGGKSSIDRLSY